MKKMKYSSLKVGFVLFTLIFAITFVSLFTYLPIYTESIKQTEQDLRQDLKLQSTILEQQLNSVIIAKTGYRKKIESDKAKQAIQALWQELALHNKGETIYLTYRNPQTNKTEIWLSNNDEPLHEQNRLLLNASLHQHSSTPSGLHINRTGNNEIIFAVYTTIIPQQWGLVIQRKTNFINDTLYEAISYTLFSALLITLISWLILRIKARSYVEDEETVAERFGEILDRTHDWIWETDPAGNIIYSSEQVSNILGKDSSLLLNTQFNDLFDQSFEPNNKLVWKQKLMLHETINNLEIALKHINGEAVHLLVTAYPLLDVNYNILGYRGIARDISEIKNREHKMINQAFYDPLTNLINRQYFIDKLAKHLDKLKVNKNTKPSAVLFIDLDGFKKVNDQKGHEIGDQLLKMIAKRMLLAGRETDLIARFGGDEFVILLKCEEYLPMNKFIVRLEEFSKSLIDVINKPVEIQNYSLNVGASIGIAMIPQDGKTVTEVLNRADAAMYQAKSRGKNTYEFYAQNTQKEVDKKIKTSGELQEAIKNDDLELHYQFQYKDSCIVGMEALLRWHHPETRKIMCASEFMHDLKDSYQTHLIDEWVINRVAKDVAILNKALPKHIPVSINLSTQEMFESSLPELVENALKKNFITSHAFNIEASENILAENFKESSKTVKKLEKLGVKTCIDHFGTGYLSLANLQLLPIESIKIDKTFIDNVATNHADLQMCRTIIKMAKSMNLKVIAEGIETTVQRDILTKEGCDMMQGYIFAHPMPLEKALTYLKDHLQLIE